MAFFVPLHTLIENLWAHRAEILSEDLPFRTKASLLALRQWGEAMVKDMTALVNVAGLALSLPRLIVHQVSPGASHLVQSAALGSLPTEPPGFMQKAWLVESRHPERGEVLFGQTVSLGGYWLEGVLFLVGILYPDGAAVASWRPGWGRDEQLDLPEVDATPLVADMEGYATWAREAALYIVRLSLLLKARQSPIESIAPGAKKKSRQQNAKAARDRGWAVRRIRLLHPEYEASPSAGGSQSPSSLSKEDRALLPVTVRGHLRRIAIGPKKQERAWRWIESHEAHRWMRNQVRVIIDP